MWSCFTLQQELQGLSRCCATLRAERGTTLEVEVVVHHLAARLTSRNNSSPGGVIKKESASHFLLLWKNSFRGGIICFGSLLPMFQFLDPLTPLIFRPGVRQKHHGGRKRLTSCQLADRKKDRKKRSRDRIKDALERPASRDCFPR